MLGEFSLRHPCFVVPPDTKLAPKPDAIKDWDSLSAVAMLFGRTPVLPGKAVESSVTAPKLFGCWLRPVSSAARVGEHRAVVWNSL